MKFNNKGFTLIEMLAVVVILGILATIMVPTVTTVIKKNKEDNYENLKKSINSAAKMYISDNRYDISLDNSNCSEDNSTRDIMTIGDNNIVNSQISVKLLIDRGYLTNGEMLGKNGKKINKDESYIKVLYSCSSKDYIYEEPEIKEETQ